MYFRFNYVTVFACIFVTIIVSVNGMDVIPLTDISVTVIVNGKNTVVLSYKRHFLAPNHVF